MKAGTFAGIRCPGIRCRKIDSESAPFALLALHLDLAAAILNNLMGYVQTQPGSFASGLGGEKCVEDPVQVFLRNPSSGIGAGNPGPTGRHTGAQC